MLSNPTFDFGAFSSPGTVTEGTITIPTLQADKWFVVDDEPNSVHYKAMSTSDNSQVAAEIFIDHSVKNNPYANTSVPKQFQLPGLASNNVYVRAILYATCSDSVTGAKYILPYPVSESLNIPQGIADEQFLANVGGLQIVVQSLLAKAGLITGTTSSCSDVSRIAQGGVRKF